MMTSCHTDYGLEGGEAKEKFPLAFVLKYESPQLSLCLFLKPKCDILTELCPRLKILKL